MTTTVINRKDTAWWGIGPIPHADYVYIGRPSRWGNPFVVGTDGSREEVIEKYRNWLLAQDAAGFISAAIEHELKNKILVCWCKPLACHGDVLAELADE